jgi:hypothetical protein
MKWQKFCLSATRVHWQLGKKGMAGIVLKSIRQGSLAKTDCFWPVDPGEAFTRYVLTGTED